MSAPIVAVATPWGVGAVALVRLSGRGTDALLRAVCGRVPAPRRATLCRLRDADGPFDEGLVVWMPGPGSYTGEDAAEVSAHGNPLLVERLVAAFLAAGARLAEPGAFTRRAFVNGRLDLVRAEAVLQTLEATSAEGLRLARDAPRVTAVAESLRDRLADLAAELEVALDYPGEDVLVADDAALAGRLAALAAEARALAATWRAGHLLVEGARVALVGPVNAGKSSLLNALAGRPRALVSDEPGTTRDVVEVAIRLPRVRVTLLDTAGERETPGAVEAAGLALGRDAAREADLRLVCVPLDRPVDAATAALLAEAPAPRLVVGTFADRPPVASLAPDVRVCAPTAAGLDALRAALEHRLLGAPAPVGAVVLGSARQRDLFEALARAADEAAEALLGGAGPAVAVEAVIAAMGVVDALVGRDTRESVLDRLFARFCIGK